MDDRGSQGLPWEKITKYEDEAIFVVEFLDDRASVSVVLNLDETRVCAYEASSCQPFLAFKQQKLDLIGPSWNVYPRTRKTKDQLYDPIRTSWIA